MPLRIAPPASIPDVYRFGHVPFFLAHGPPRHGVARLLQVVVVRWAWRLTRYHGAATKGVAGHLPGRKHRRDARRGLRAYLDYRVVVAPVEEYGRDGCADCDTKE